jgi:FMN-dependent oxidoreductase (nitrilotriacetate monooxygenase family)
MRYLGYHPASWRHPEVPADGAIQFEHFLGVARKAEASKLDMVFFADGVAVRAEDNPEGALCRDMKNAELEPLTLLAALGACTSNIGLVSTASTTYNEPFHIARKFASIDHISKGRAGWNVVTSWSPHEAWNFNRENHLGYADRYERAAEFVDVVTGLWDGWEADAFMRDKESGQFYDPQKMHVLNHKGKHFSVRGPLNSARTPQGRPIIVQAGASEQGRDIAARTADIIYTNAFELEAAQAYYADMKKRAVEYGRSPDEILVMPGVTFYVGRTREEAQAKLDELQALIHPLSGLAMLYSYMGDLSGHDLDGPVPEPTDAKLASISQNLLSLARRDNLSIRQLYNVIAAGGAGRYIVGTPEEIVDDLQLWFENGAADGFNICPAILPTGMDDVAQFIVPELQRRGLFRTEYEGTTLRANLGLPDPQLGDIAARAVKAAD